MIMKVHLKINLPLEMQNHSIGSLLHGVLMEKMTHEQASMLHNYRYSPLKQRLKLFKDHCLWEVVSLENNLTMELKEVFEDLHSIYIEHRQQELPVEIISMNIFCLDDWLTAELNRDEYPSSLKIKFFTPTSFKSDGAYEIFPDLRKILRSVMMNFDYFSEGTKLYDYETLEYLTECIKISQYQLQSTSFHLEQTRIPSFKGTLVLKIKGSHQIRQLIHLIFSYAELAGVGIKTSLGMGAIELKHPSHLK